MARRPSVWLTAALLLLAAISTLPLIRADRRNRLLAAVDLLPAVMQVGLGDHIRCALLHIPKPGDPNPENAVEPLDAPEQSFIDTLRTSLPPNAQFSAAHHCRFQGRRVVHAVIRSESGPASLVIVSRHPQETFESVKPVILPSGLSAYQARAGQYRVTAYATTDYLAFVVSEEAPGRHQDLASAMISVFQGVFGQR